MTPLWFGPEERPLLGWYHAPDGAPREACVVMCPPFGFEYNCCYRSYRRLAQLLAAAGFPVLRFDYDGTGESAGTNWDPGRVGAWLESIRLASDEVRRLSGVSSVSLFGVRLGALLAVAAAPRVRPASMVLWAAPASGKAFTREQKILAQTADAALAQAKPLVPPPLEEGDQEAAGYLLTKETIAALAKLDIGKVAEAPAPHALVIARDDLPDDRKVATHLSSLGVDVTSTPLAGYVAMMSSPEVAETATAALERIQDWLAARHARRGDAGAAPPPPGRQVAAWALADGARVRERIVSFPGQHGVLLGVLAAPDRALDERARRRGVLWINTGADRRSGRNSLHTTTMRAWAARHGATSLRIDLGGIGDSDGEGPKERFLYSLAVVADVRAATRFLREAHGITEVLLIGHCSGAYVAFHSALEDPALREILLVNPQTIFFEPGTPLELRRTSHETHIESYYRQAALRADSWRRLFRGESDFAGIWKTIVDRTKRVWREHGRALLAMAVGPPRERVLDIFRRLLGRDVRVLIVFSEGDNGQTYLEQHLGKGLRLLPRRRSLRTEIVRGPDHPFSPLWCQRWLAERLTRCVIRWLR